MGRGHFFKQPIGKLAKKKTEKTVLVTIQRICSFSDLKTRCGAIFDNKNRGWFTPPARKIDPTLDIEVFRCLWIIKNTGKKLIRFQLTDMMLDVHPQCKLAKVTVGRE